MESFGELLRRLRVAAGLTQEMLAKSAGVSVDAVGTLERGVRLTPRADTARLLADALGLDGEDRRRFVSASAPHPRLRGSVGAVRSDAGMLAAARPVLPSPLTALVGRAALVQRVRRLLAEPRRLITLTGPGGVGKTRVALAVADSAPDVVGWVDLAALSDPAGVPYAVAEEVGLVSDPGIPLVVALRHWSAGHRGLLVLDNCEHLLVAVADLVAGMLAGSDGVRVLATSRERIGMPGEQVVVVPPLRLPAPGGRDRDAEAVQLFTDRAMDAAPGFILDDALLGRVAGICRALDGLPLAIELAAARVGTLTVEDLAVNLDARFELLSARHGVDPRHHTLRAVVDWSYDLLSEPERLLFARLSVFAAEFDLAAAKAVAADDRVPSGRIAHLVALLADRSMLTRPGQAGVGRYRMLETLKAYAASRLSDRDLDRVRRAHARYVVEVAERADDGLTGPHEAAWAARIEAWLDDAQAAYRWAREASEVDLAVRLVVALSRWACWRMRTDVLAWAQPLIQTAAEHPRLPVLYATAAGEAWLSGRLMHGRELARRALATAGGIARVGTVMAAEFSVMCVFLGVPFEEMDATSYGFLPIQGPQLSPNAVDASGGAERHGALGPELDSMIAMYGEIVTQTEPYTASRAVALAAQAHAMALYRNDPAAGPLAREAVAHARASGNPSATAHARYLGAMVDAGRDPSAALSALDDARAIASGVGCRVTSTFALAATLTLRARHGSPQQALALFYEAVGLWRSTGNEPALRALLTSLVILLIRTGQDRDAVDLAATLRSTGSVHILDTGEPIEEAVAGARHRLGREAADAAWAAGAARDLDEATDRARQLLAELLATEKQEGRTDAGDHPPAPTA